MLAGYLKTYGSGCEVKMFELQKWTTTMYHKLIISTIKLIPVIRYTLFPQWDTNREAFWVGAGSSRVLVDRSIQVHAESSRYTSWLREQTAVGVELVAVTCSSTNIRLSRDEERKKKCACYKLILQRNSDNNAAPRIKLHLNQNRPCGGERLYWFCFGIPVQEYQYR